MATLQSGGLRIGLRISVNMGDFKEQAGSKLLIFVDEISVSGKL